MNCFVGLRQLKIHFYKVDNHRNPVESMWTYNSLCQAANVFQQIYIRIHENLNEL